MSWLKRAFFSQVKDRVPLNTVVVVKFGHDGVRGRSCGYMGDDRTVIETNNFGYLIRYNEDVSVYCPKDPSDG